MDESFRARVKSRTCHVFIFLYNMQTHLKKSSILNHIPFYSPLAHPDWFFEGKNVNNKPGDRITRHNRTAGKRLLIKDTYLSDQGTYTCIANNEVGKPMNHSIYLKVVGEYGFVKK